MSDTETAPVDPDAQTQSLDEFCMHHSARSPGQEKAHNGVEALAAFAHVEKAAGRMRDTHAAYMDRLHKLMNSPA